MKKKNEIKIKIKNEIALFNSNFYYIFTILLKSNKL
jgi:hypothetical protein